MYRKNLEDLKWKVKNIEHKLELLKQEFNVEKGDLNIRGQQHLQSLKSKWTIVLSIVAIGITVIIFGFPGLIGEEISKPWIAPLLIFWIIGWLVVVLRWNFISQKAFVTLTTIQEGYDDAIQFLSSVQSSISDATYDLKIVESKEIDNIDSFLDLTTLAGYSIVYDTLEEASKSTVLNDDIRKRLDILGGTVTAEQVKEAYNEVDFDLLPEDLKALVESMIQFYLGESKGDKANDESSGST